MANDKYQNFVSERTLKNLEKEKEYLKTCVKNTKDLMTLQNCESEKRMEYLNSLIEKQNKIIESYEQMISELNRSIGEFLKKSDAK